MKERPIQTELHYHCLKSMFDFPFTAEGRGEKTGTSEDASALSKEVREKSWQRYMQRSMLNDLRAIYTDKL